MAVRKWEEFGHYIQRKIGDEPTEEDIQFLEDFEDTVRDSEARAGEDWKTKYEQLDREWKKKYTDRFFNRDEGAKTEDEEKENEEVKYTKYEDLFKEECV